MKFRSLFSAALVLMLGGCLDSDVTSPEFESRLWSLLGVLEVGEAMQFEGAAAERVFLAGGDNGASYVIVPFHASPSGTQRLSIELTGGSAATSRSSVIPSGLATGDADPYLAHRILQESTDQFHTRLRQYEQHELEPLLGGGASADGKIHRAATAAGVRPLPQRGDPFEFRVPDPNATSDLCEEYLERTGRVVTVTDRTILVLDDSNPPGGAGDEDLIRIVQDFDELAYPTIVEHFGEPTDLDGNDRVIVVFTSVVNDFQAGGFFFSGDLFARGPASDIPPEGSSICPASNEGEIFYIFVPDPTGQTAFPVSREFVLQVATGTLGHELQHLINASRRIYINHADGYEEVWLNEGLSHIAEELVFYAATPFGPGENLTLNDIQQVPGAVDALNEFLAQNLLRYSSYLRNPQAESLMGIDNLPTRGASWAFLRYATDHEPADSRGLFFALANSRTRGLQNLNEVLTRGDAIDLMQDWTLSAFTDDLDYQRLPDRFQQPSWNFRSVLPPYSTNGRYPLQILPLGTGELNLSLRGGGAAFVRASTDAGAHQQISVTSGSATPPASLRLSIVRTD